MIDGDIYGPNVPIMLGISTQLTTDGQKIVPAEQYGLQLVSMAFLTNDDSPVIWRGPMLHGVIQQFFREVRWDAIDYLIVDMPPGTGDVALSLSQTVPVSGSVVVTTPQTVSVADTRRAVRMYQKLNVPTLGLIENMSHFVCPSCRHESDIFGKGGGEALASELGVPFLGRIPLYEPIRRGGDTGVPITVGEPTSPAAAGVSIRRRAAGGADLDRRVQRKPGEEADCADAGPVGVQQGSGFKGSGVRVQRSGFRVQHHENDGVRRVRRARWVLAAASAPRNRSRRSSSLVRRDSVAARGRQGRRGQGTGASDCGAGGVDGEGTARRSRRRRRALEAASDLEAAREAFGPLTDAVMAAGKAEGWKDVEGVRLAFCPMVKQSWLQKDEQIRNPYYGSGDADLRRVQAAQVGPGFSPGWTVCVTASR